MNAARAIADKDIPGALHLADAIGDLQLRARFCRTLLARWATKDPVSAVNRASAIADPAQRHSATLAVLDGWMNRNQPDHGRQASPAETPKHFPSQKQDLSFTA